MKVADLKPNPRNPRNISPERIEKLRASIEQFPEMMSLRPIVIDANGVVLGGNMRLAAIKRLGKTEIPDDWVKRADDLTDDQKREFAIKDNANFGEWDFDLLANEWDDLPLGDWCVDVPEPWDDEDADEPGAKTKEPVICPHCGGVVNEKA